MKCLTLSRPPKTNIHLKEVQPYGSVVLSISYDNLVTIYHTVTRVVCKGCGVRGKVQDATYQHTREYETRGRRTIMTLAASGFVLAEGDAILPVAAVLIVTSIHHMGGMGKACWVPWTFVIA